MCKKSNKKKTRFFSGKPNKIYFRWNKNNSLLTLFSSKIIDSLDIISKFSHNFVFYSRKSRKNFSLAKRERKRIQIELDRAHKESSWNFSGVEWKSKILIKRFMSDCLFFDSNSFVEIAQISFHLIVS